VKSDRIAVQVGIDAFYAAIHCTFVRVSAQRMSSSVRGSASGSLVTRIHIMTVHLFSRTLVNQVAGEYTMPSPGKAPPPLAPPFISQHPFLVGNPVILPKPQGPCLCANIPGELQRTVVLPHYRYALAAVLASVQ